jgi:hypothetical protein
LPGGTISHPQSDIHLFQPILEKIHVELGTFEIGSVTINFLTRGLAGFLSFAALPGVWLLGIMLTDPREFV